MKKQPVKTFIANHIKSQSTIYLFVCVLFMMGVIFGAIIVNSMTFSQKEDLFFYLSRFFGQVTDGKVADSAEMFQQSFMHNIKYLGLIWILGISIIGLPIILIMLFLKGMVVGFTVGFLVNQMGWNGFLLSFVSILPQNMIMIPVFIILSAAALSFSLKLAMYLLNRKRNLQDSPLQSFSKYAGVFAGIIVMIAAAAALEAFASPELMKAVVQLVKK
ncbi:stage II sporulation protein M [Bacillus sp. FJAT-42376]|uniref:stage II sporulation protein M n=1 Tax=Bacillus sp. FJAT-42376 TaxID=2014076 RepID=UPI000F50B421|nr:stage II sporulation protein M [Bacillus sp. FJAT-42376]AZB43420.1 stage II sporulation protein M [Bacillus sp. FJAT-42376]